MRVHWTLVANLLLLLLLLLLHVSLKELTVDYNCPKTAFHSFLHEI